MEVKYHPRAHRIAKKWIKVSLIYGKDSLKLGKIVKNSLYEKLHLGISPFGRIIGLGLDL